jgi:hypothetical protein
MFAHIFKLPYEQPDFSDFSTGLFREGYLESFREMISPEAKDKIIKYSNMLNEFYASSLQPFTNEQISTLIGTKYGTVPQIAIDIKNAMEEKMSHPTKIDTSYRRPQKENVQRFTLTGEEQWASHSYTSLREVLDVLIANKRFTSWSPTGAINFLAIQGGGTSISDLHRSAGKVQLPQMELAIDGFFAMADQPRPADRTEALKKMAEISRFAEKNARLLNFLYAIRNQLDKIKA